MRFPELRVALWPADYQLTLTIRLGFNQLRLEAEVFNPDTKPLPFGLGYHPYFKVPFAATGNAASCLMQVPARSYWPLTDSLPNGDRACLVESARDLLARVATAISKFDDVLTRHNGQRPGAGRPAGMRHYSGRSQAFAADALLAVVFASWSCSRRHTGRLFCVEPYTCVTDAINLQARGVDAGWLTLAPGQRWNGVVEMRA